MIGVAAPMAFGGEAMASEECEELRNKNKGAAIRMRMNATAMSPLIIFDHSSRYDSLVD